MSIEYTYTIAAVDQEARCMEIIYTAPNRQTMHIGARLPYVGETLEAIVQMYAPVAYWLEQEQKVVSVDIGVSGAVGPKVQSKTLAAAKEAKLAELAAVRYAREVEGVTIDGMVYDTSRISQQQIFVTNALLQSGQIETATWKTSNYMFIPHTATSFSTVASAVVEHVQELFRIESELASAVAAAQSVADVEKIEWPV